MASLKKIAVAVAAGVWTSALSSAVALAYVLNRPLEPRIPAEPLTAHASVGHLLGEAASTDKLLEMTPIAPVTPARRVLVSKPAPAASVVDISQMRCNEWRELQMGSGHVMVCEP